ncbi:YqaE/Pmp3 family membrane protein [Rufibacter roseus]|uniref:YqaE/Pmp3 family membrane protein n=1 Tax=Rufibacter roseus TaxID=1567108 RepID=A0ABW2DJA1_9BACT|nr:YqaE/Pmp3 family membrane protein [Rufibacter roseus]
MKIKSLLKVMSIALAGQFLFSCNTAEYYRFAPVSSNSSYNKAKVKPAEEAKEAQVVVAEDMLASTSPDTDAAPADLEANASSPAPVLFEKEVLKKKNIAKVEKQPNAPESNATINEAAALSEAKERLASMSKAEKKAFKKEVKKALRESQATSNVLLIILAILLPPLAVGLYEGITNRFWISLILTILGVLPGVIYSLLVVTGTI